MKDTNHSWLQRNIRPVVTLGCLAAFIGGTLGIPFALRGTNLTDLELQIIWSVFSLYVVGRTAEKGISIHKNGA